MSVYVDQLRDHSAAAHRLNRVSTHWCHMTADSLEELHDMAKQLGLKPEWFQAHPLLRRCHYDLTPSRRVFAVYLRAISVNTKSHLRELQHKGKYDTPAQ